MSSLQPRKKWILKQSKPQGVATFDFVKNPGSFQSVLNELGFSMLAEMLLATSKNMEETQNELETKSLQKLNLSNKDGFNCFIKLFRD